MIQEAIKRIERLRGDVESSFGVPPQEKQDAHDRFIEEMDSEDFGRYCATVDTFDAVLVELKALRDHGTRGRPSC